MIRKLDKCVFLFCSMSVKEIRELEEEIKEIKSSDSEKFEEGNSWDEEDVKGDAEEEKKEEKFSIGDTMLARGSAVDSWGGNSLEEELEGEEFDRGFDDDVFDEEEEFGDEGFSYDAVGQSGADDMYGTGAGGGDLYGAGSSGRDLYGTGGSGADLYGASGQKGSDSVGMYNTSGGSGESSMYNTGSSASRKKSTMGSVYQVEGSKKKGAPRRVRSSKLESGFSGPKRRAKGLSMM